jgi:hypothetical protein
MPPLSLSSRRTQDVLRGKEEVVPAIDDDTDALLPQQQ